MDETGVPTVKGINDLSDKNKIEELLKKVKYPIIVKAAKWWWWKRNENCHRRR